MTVSEQSNQSQLEKAIKKEIRLLIEWIDIQSFFVLKKSIIYAGFVVVTKSRITTESDTIR